LTIVMYIRNSAGQVIAETSGDGTLDRKYIYAGFKQLTIKIKND